PPGGAEHAHVAEEQAVDLDLGDRAAGEADDDQPALGSQEPEAVEEAVAAHRVDDDVDAAAGQLPYGVGPAGATVARAGVDHRLGPGRLGHGPLLGPGGHSHHPGAEGPGDLDDRNAEPAPGPLHQDLFPRLEPGPAGQGEPGRLVVDDEPGGGGETHTVGNRDHRGRNGGGLLGEGAAENEGRPPVTGGESRPGGGMADDAGHFEARHEGQIRPDLVLAPGHEEVGETDPGGVDLDQGRAEGVGLGRRHVLHGDSVRAGELPQDQRSHRPIVVRPAPAGRNDECGHWRSTTSRSWCPTSRRRCASTPTSSAWNGGPTAPTCPWAGPGSTPAPSSCTSSRARRRPGSASTSPCWSTTSTPPSANSASGVWRSATPARSAAACSRSCPTRRATSSSCTRRYRRRPDGA